MRICRAIFILFSERFVALVVGGQNNGSVEVLSPDGKCKHQLADVPLGSYEPFFHIPVLAYIDGKILACAGDTDIGGGTVQKYP
jgi:hypothetical protein